MSGALRIEMIGRDTSHVDLADSAPGDPGFEHHIPGPPAAAEESGERAAP